MRDRPAPTPSPEEPRFGPADWLVELRHLLFSGAATNESRIEFLLDRVERRP